MSDRSTEQTGGSATKAQAAPRRGALLLLAGVAAWSLLAASSAQAATVSVGSPLAAPFTGSLGGIATEINFTHGEPEITTNSRVIWPVIGSLLSVAYHTKW